MPTAQVDAWAAVHRGSLGDIFPLIDEALADAAVARMMLHRRRAVIPRIIGEFFARAGGNFMPHLGDLATEAAVDLCAEIAAAKAAGQLAESACREAPPLLFERAMLSDMEGRAGDAQADLRRLLESYPGFVAAAFAAARLTLTSDDPVSAIEVLACVERELVQTREGAALLADALRAVGMYEAASRYDLTSLTNVGYLDSRGNDCAPVDAAGKVVSHKHMLPAFYVGMLPGGRMLYNDRGVYYVAGSVVSNVLFALFGSIRSRSVITGCVPQNSTYGSGALRAAMAKLTRFFYQGEADAVRLRALAAAALKIWRRLAWLRRGADHALRRMLPRLAAYGLLQIPERDRRSRVVQDRVRAGVTSIFGISALKLDSRHTPQASEPGLAAGQNSRAISSERANPVPLRQFNALPPKAEEALHRLASKAGMALR